MRHHHRYEGWEHGCCCCCGCCCCGHHGHHDPYGHHRRWHEAHGCCTFEHEPFEEGRCIPRKGFRRRFVSREERIAELEAYLADLKAEAKAVEEEIARLRSAG